jgi:hypothetical protein
MCPSEVCSIAEKFATALPLCSDPCLFFLTPALLTLSQFSSLLPLLQLLVLPVLRRSEPHRDSD